MGGRTRPEDDQGLARDDSRWDRTVSVEGDNSGTSAEASDTLEWHEVEWSERYVDRGEIGAGGMGSIRRVWDRRLRGEVVMKLLRSEHRHNEGARRRLLLEAAVLARLHHPAIPAVHDCGRLDDGRPWFTMREVQGRTFAEEIAEVHRGLTLPPEAMPRLTVSHRRLISIFVRVCEAIEYAHSRGVIHRDLKPHNVMIGAFGEVVVLDWGLARSAHSDDVPGGHVLERQGAQEPALTRAGATLGTPAYMAPEQASGDQDRVGPLSDIYALGAILFQILEGRPPHLGSPGNLIRGLREGTITVPSPRLLGREEEYVALMALAQRALARDPADRPPRAADLVVAANEWLDGVRRGKVADDHLAEAARREVELAAMVRTQEELRSEAVALARRAVGDRERLWEVEDRADALAREVDVLTARLEHTLQSALRAAPHHRRARRALAEHYLRRLAEAEQNRDGAAARFEVFLRAHADEAHLAWLDGAGRIDLVTSPPGADVAVAGYTQRSRRLMVGEWRPLGRTPLRDAEVPRGSHLLRLSAPGHRAVLYPVVLDRSGRWSPDEPLPLLRDDTLSKDDCYVPAGPTVVGGDPAAPDCLPRARIWVDGFVMRRFPVTNAEFVGFLNALMEVGDEETALECAPREPRAAVGEGARTLVYRRKGGRFILGRDMSGSVRHPNHPVSDVTWKAATAFADWYAARTGLAWRLPDEIEWEKAARGVDGRVWPWGDHFDSTWACTMQSHPGRPVRAKIHEFPDDESPYGVRGLAGNVRDWCRNSYHRGPPTDGGRLDLVVEGSSSAGSERAVRGGAFSSTPLYCRPAARFGLVPGQALSALGFRLCRSLCGGAS